MDTAHATAHVTAPRSITDELRLQRWDDHRLYHHSRVNQTLHLVSALCFLIAYVIIWFDLVTAVLIGWLLAMVTRQTGHFLFEPKTYDARAHMTHRHKESIKVGYNLFRKVLLLSAWVAMPLLLLASPTVFGLLPAPVDTDTWLWNLCVLWLAVGVAAVLGRTTLLSLRDGPVTGSTWMLKILTDPFHDVKIYWRSPLHVIRGQWLDPMEPWPDMG